MRKPTLISSYQPGHQGWQGFRCCVSDQAGVRTKINLQLSSAPNKSLFFENLTTDLNTFLMWKRNRSANRIGSNYHPTQNK